MSRDKIREQLQLWNDGPVAKLLGKSPERRQPFLTAQTTDSKSRLVAAATSRSGVLWLGTWNEGLGRLSAQSRVLSDAVPFEPRGEVSAIACCGRRGGRRSTWTRWSSARASAKAA